MEAQKLKNTHTDIIGHVYLHTKKNVFTHIVKFIFFRTIENLASRTYKITKTHTFNLLSGIFDILIRIYSILRR